MKCKQIGLKYLRSLKYLNLTNFFSSKTMLSTIMAKKNTDSTMLYVFVYQTCYLGKSDKNLKPIVYTFLISSVYQFVLFIFLGFVFI